MLDLIDFTTFVLFAYLLSSVKGYCGLVINKFIRVCLNRIISFIKVILIHLELVQLLPSIVITPWLGKAH